MTNLIEVLQGSLGSTLAREGARYLGESPGAMNSAVGSLLPALLGGVVKQGSTPDGAARLLGMLQRPEVDANLASNLGSLLGGGGSGLDSLLRGGGSLVSSLLGERGGALASTLSSMSGIKPASATTLLALAVPAVLGFLKGLVQQGRLDARGLMSLLLGQKDFLHGKLDDRLTTAMGLGSASSLLAGLGGAASAAAGSAAGGLKRWFPWLIGVLAILVLIALLRSCGRPAQDALETAGESVDQAARAMSKLSLPDGSTIDVPEGGFIARLVAILQDPAADLSKGLPFDDLNYDTGRATISTPSMSQLSGLATVLKAYPAVTIRVEGHTDNEGGDSAANLELSKARATAVKAALAAHGVAPERIEAVGYGPDRPLADNATEAGRAANRRTELYVTKR